MVVAGAPAKVPGQGGLDFVRARVWIRRQQRGGRQQLARGAEAALRRVVIDKGLLQRTERAVAGEALDCLHRRALGPHGELTARVHRTAVQQDRARAALAAIASDFGAGEIQMIAQQFDERDVIVDVHRPARGVDRQRDCRLARDRRRGGPLPFDLAPGAPSLVEGLW